VFDVAFIQEKGNGRLMLESELVREHCIRLEIPTQLYTPKRIDRRQLPLTRHYYIFGDMDCMHGAMRQLKIPIPEAIYYPQSLTQHLHRKVWLDTLGDIKRRVEDGGGPVFCKPASRAKAFTGRVFSDHSDFYHIGGTSLREPVWCSDVVSWRSEFRAYVNAGEIAIDHYDGDAGVELDLATVTRAISEYGHSGEAPVAYGIDFGVLASGQTALVEANDGYALGAYKIGSAPYAELTFARWRQLLESTDDIGDG
jgi:hypothetical protein